MPQTLKKLRGHIALGLSVHACVHASVKKNPRVFKFHKWIPHKKINLTVFLKFELSPFVELCPF